MTAQITDTNGDTSTVQGLVERSGLVWVNNLPLAAGTNLLTVTATNAAGYSMTTNLTLVQSTVTVTMNPLTQFNEAAVTVNGTISDSTCSLTVNGVSAYYLDGLGDWQATNVPVNPVGTAVFNLQVYTGDPTLLGSLILEQPQQAVVGLTSYIYHYYDNVEDYNDCEGVSPATETTTIDINWTCQAGGSGIQTDKGISECSPDNDYSQTSLTGGYNGYSPLYADGLFTTTENTFTPPYFAGGSFTLENQKFSVNEQPAIYGTDQAALGQKSLYLVTAQVDDEATEEQVLPSALHYMNQVPGTPVIGVTNDGVLISSQFLAYGTAGVTNPLTITPLTEGRNTVYFPNYFWTATNVTLQIIDANTGSNLTTQVNNVIVGQQMNLRCQLSVTNNALLNNSMLTNFQWTVPGDAVTNFYVSHDLFQTNGYAIYLSATNNQGVYFWWADGKTNANLTASRIVRCAATMNGATITGQAAFNVLSPMASITATTSDVSLGYTFNAGYYGICFGTTNEGVAGISFSPSVVMPLGISYNNGNTNYFVEWVQLITSYQEYIIEGGVEHNFQTSGTNLDDVYDYGFTTYPNTDDSPSITLSDTNEIAASDTQVSKMWLMFRPYGGRFVPLRTVSWSFSGTATNSNTGWILTSRSWTTNPPDADAGQIYPTWIDNVADTNTFQWNPPFSN